MKHIALYFGIATALVASCSVKEENFETPKQDDVIFYASFEQPAEQTKVYANEDLYLRWNADDRVSIFNKNTYNQQYKFTGETGDNAGGFRKVDTDEFVTGNTLANVVSVYPYQENTKITEDGTLMLTLPAEQQYAEKTFGLGANTMVSVSSDNFLQYRNVCGYLMLKLYGDDVFVSSITLKGNNGERLAGRAFVTIPLEGVPSATLNNDADTEITLICKSPIRLGKTEENCTQFWIVIPPVTFENGFTITVRGINGGVFTKKTSNCTEITRSNLSKMSAVAVEISEPDPEGVVDLGLSVKWASCNLGASKPEDYGDYFAWGETEPKSEYNWGTYKWCNGSENTLTKYNTRGDLGPIDQRTTLEMEDDAARVNLGGIWRIPTEAEMQELCENCTREWTTENGVYGVRLTSKIEGYTDKSIFLPPAGDSSHFAAGTTGYYWSSSVDTVDPNRAARLIVGAGTAYWWNTCSRCSGFPIRPVYAE